MLAIFLSVLVGIGAVAQPYPEINEGNSLSPTAAFNAQEGVPSSVPGDSNREAGGRNFLKPHEISDELVQFTLDQVHKCGVNIPRLSREDSLVLVLKLMADEAITFEAVPIEADGVEREPEKPIVISECGNSQTWAIPQERFFENNDNVECAMCVERVEKCCATSCHHSDQHCFDIDCILDPTTLEGKALVPTDK